MDTDLDIRRKGARACGRTNRNQGTVLLVEDSPLIAKMVAAAIRSSLPYDVQIAGSYAEAKRFFTSSEESYHAAVVCLALPDAPDGEIVDLATNAGTPTIVLTGDYDDKTRDHVLTKPVVDYFVKQKRSLGGLNFTLHRLGVNAKVEILLVDDSPTQRACIRQLLDAHRFLVHEAADGVEALSVLDEHPGVTLVITDYEMPRMNGVELVVRLRERRASDELAIVGLSSTGIDALSARYLKSGADDFLTKPFGKEEFYCRLYRSLVNLDHIAEIKRAAYTDQLTGLPNRLGFFRTVPDRFVEAIESSRPFAVGMIDIDHFKNINDTYGHAAGDAALQRLAKILDATPHKPFLAARFGGEEFCCLAMDVTPAEARDLFDALRVAVESMTIEYKGQHFHFTVSVGVATFDHSDLDASINRADALLYEAKRSGRNRIAVEISEPRPVPLFPIVSSQQQWLDDGVLAVLEQDRL